jgi:hypothetical protein
MAEGPVARELRVDLARVDLSRVVGKHVCVTEENLHGVFDAVESAGTTWVFDEADALPANAPTSRRLTTRFVVSRHLSLHGL